MTNRIFRPLKEVSKHFRSRVCARVCVCHLVHVLLYLINSFKLFPIKAHEHGTGCGGLQRPLLARVKHSGNIILLFFKKNNL